MAEEVSIYDESSDDTSDVDMSTLWIPNSHQAEFTWPSQPDEECYQYLVVNKERREMEGPIQEVDVVRVKNGVFSRQGEDETKIWKTKTTMCCPTYGNCNICMRSGPVAMGCGFCNTSLAGYQVMVMGREHEKQLIDAEWLSKCLGRDGHVVAMANRKVGWLRTPLWIMREDSELINQFMPRFTSDELIPFMIQYNARHLVATKMRNNLYAGWIKMDAEYWEEI